MFFDTADIIFHIRLVTYNRSDCKFVPYCKMFLCIQTLTYTRADNHKFETNSAIPV